MIKLKKPLTIGWHTTQAAYDNMQTQTELQVAFSILNVSCQHQLGNNTGT